MHYKTIAEKALELGLVKTTGKTPEATLYAQVLTQVQRRKKRGERGRFVTHGKGYVEAALPNKIPVGLMNGDQLVALLVENDIGSKKTQHTLIDLIAEPAEVAGNEDEH